MEKQHIPIRLLEIQYENSSTENSIIHIFNKLKLTAFPIIEGSGGQPRSEVSLNNFFRIE